MAGVEWGPNVPVENRRLLEVTRFSGQQLQDINARVTSYLQADSSATRHEAVVQLTQSEKEFRRMQLGLDVLNQLHVVDRSGSDIDIVIVRQDSNSDVQKAPDGEEPRAGEGQHHLWYEIAWIREPDQKPSSPNQPAAQTNAAKPAYPFVTAEQRAVANAGRTATRRSDRERRQKERAERAAREKEQERITAERKAIDAVVIDTVKDVGEYTLTRGSIKIELGEGGTAVILYRHFFGEYAAVDRETGEYHPYKVFPQDAHSIDTKYLGYFNVLAQQAEGKDVSYSPEPLDPQVYQDIYERAIKAEMIKVEQDPERGILFQYVKYYNSLYSYAEMDLEREVVDVSGWSKAERPINPHFAEFLRQKKAELESQGR